MKSHASATGSRSAMTTPALLAARDHRRRRTRAPRGSACGRAAAITGSSAASLSAWIQRSTSRTRSSLRHVRVGDPRRGSGAGSSAIASSAPSRKLAPRLVEAREVEVALRAEMAVQDRLADARLARDLGRRRAAVARASKNTRQAASSTACRRSPRGSRGSRSRHRRSRRLDRVHVLAGPRGADCLRIATVATIAADEREQRRRRAARRGSRARSRLRIVLPRRPSSRCREATIAPITAIPSDPPTWRNVFSTAEPTPALSTLHRAHRGGGDRRHRRAPSRRRRAASPGRSDQKRRVHRRGARREERDREQHMPPPRAARADPVGEPAPPAARRG